MTALAPSLYAASSTKAFWYLTRGAGVVTLLLLTASLLLGIMTSRDLSWRRLPRFVVVAVHRNVSLLALVLLTVHVVTVVVDGYVKVGWVDAVVPFASAYHPLTLGLGAVGLDLLLAVVVTSAFRSRLSFHSWRLVHWLAYACWPIAFVHGLLLGTDRWEGWMLVLDLVCGVTVGAAVAVRPWRGAATTGAMTSATPGGTRRPLAGARR